MVFWLGGFGVFVMFWSVCGVVVGCLLGCLVEGFVSGGGFGCRFFCGGGCLLWCGGVFVFWVCLSSCVL